MKWEYYYYKNGKPIRGKNAVLKWAKLYKNRRYKIVKQGYSFLGFWVSTVFLGINHNYSFKGPPLIYETMVFFNLFPSFQIFSLEIKKWHDFDMNRYSTRKQALAGHKEMLRNWSNPIFVFKRLILKNDR